MLQTLIIKKINLLQKSTMSYSNQLGNQETVMVQHTSVRLPDNQVNFPDNQFAHLDNQFANPDNQFCHPGNQFANLGNQFDTASYSYANVQETTKQNNCSDELV